MTDESSALVPLPASAPGDGALIPFNELDPTAAAPRVWTSLDRSKPADQQHLIMALQSPHKPLVDHCGATIPVRALVARRVHAIDTQSGEVKALTQTILVTPEGECYSGTGEGLKDSIYNLVNVLGPGPWEPPLLLQPNAVKTRRGFKTVLLHYCGVQKPPARKGVA